MHWSEGTDTFSDDDGLPRRPPRAGLVIGAASLTSILTVVVFYLFLPRAGIAVTVVPILVGLPESRARLEVEGARLALVVMGSAPDPLVERGAVARQEPLAGTRLPRGSQVLITLSQGPPRSPLPNLKGLSLAQVDARLQPLGLRRGEVSFQARPGVEEGTVISSDPVAGALLAPGTRVQIVVARSPEAKEHGSVTPDAPPPLRPPLPGPPPPRPPPVQAPMSSMPGVRSIKTAPGTPGGMVTVPKVVGGRLPFAMAKLKAVGLAVGQIRHERDEDHIESFVLRQTPAPGSSAQRGSIVDLVVNRLE